MRVGQTGSHAAKTPMDTFLHPYSTTRNLCNNLRQSDARHVTSIQSPWPRLSGSCPVPSVGVGKESASASVENASILPTP